MKTGANPSSNQRIAWLDFARGFAIFTIVLYHFLDQLDPPAPLSYLIRFGGTGIHLFFFLSGFGLCLSPPVSACNFYQRRFVKVVWPYYLLVLLSFLLSRFLPIFQEFGWKELFSHLFFYKMFFEDYIGSFGYQLWFISTLIQFYLFFPFLRKGMRKLGEGRFLMLAFVLSAGYWVLVWWLGKTSFRVWNSFFLSYLWEFALGMVLATKWPQISWKQYPWWEYAWVAVLGTGIMVGMVRIFGESAKLFNDLPALAGYTAFCLLVFRISETHFRGLARAGIQLGKVSYPFFLVHMLVLLLYQVGLKGMGIPYNWMHIPVVLLLAYWAAVGFQKLLPSST